jgi:N-acetyl-anhydromuramoyl-L-alanine amidase
VQQQNLTMKDGWLSHCRQVKSPNYNKRPAPHDISLLVIHNISLPPGQFGDFYIADFFCNQLDIDAHPCFAELANLQVSAHLLINRSGDITQFVSFEDRAWHAGLSFFQDRDNCNDFSIGIELEGTDAIPYTDAQYSALVRITRLLLFAYPLLTEERIVGHCDIAPTRKTDPGPAFDWQRYRQALKT